MRGMILCASTANGWHCGVLALGVCRWLAEGGQRAGTEQGDGVDAGDGGYGVCCMPRGARAALSRALPRDDSTNSRLMMLRCLFPSLHHSVLRPPSSPVPVDPAPNLQRLGLFLCRAGVLPCFLPCFLLPSFHARERSPDTHHSTAQAGFCLPNLERD